MRVLAFDSALDGCSAAILDGERVLTACSRPEIRGQAESLAPLIQSTLAQSGLSIGALDAIAVTIGPGTFTGLRIALALARGMGLAAGKPVIGITTLQALAAGVPVAERISATVIASIDARRGEIYTQTFVGANLTKIDEAAIMPLAAVAARRPKGPLLVVGSGASLLADFIVRDRPEISIGIRSDRIQAVAVAQLAQAQPWPPTNTAPPKPLYLRPPDAKLPTASGL